MYSLEHLTNHIFHICRHFHLESGNMVQIWSNPVRSWCAKENVTCGRGANICLAESTKLFGTCCWKTWVLSDFNKQVQESWTELMLSSRRESVAPPFFFLPHPKFLKFLSIMAYVSANRGKHTTLKAKLSSRQEVTQLRYSSCIQARKFAVAPGEGLLWSLMLAGAPWWGGPVRAVLQLVNLTLILVLRHPLRSWPNSLRGLHCCKLSCRGQCTPALEPGHV